MKVASVFLFIVFPFVCFAKEVTDMDKILNTFAVDSFVQVSDCLSNKASDSEKLKIIKPYQDISTAYGLKNRREKTRKLSEINDKNDALYFYIEKYCPNSIVVFTGVFDRLPKDEKYLAMVTFESVIYSSLAQQVLSPEVNKKIYDVLHGDNNSDGY